MSSGMYGEGGIPPDKDNMDLGESVPISTSKANILNNLQQAFGNNGQSNITQNDTNLIQSEHKHYDLNTRYRPSDKGPFFVHVESKEKNIGKLHAIRVGHYLKQDPSIRAGITDIKSLGRNKIKIEFRNFDIANKIIEHKCITENNFIAYIPKFFVERKGIARGVDTFFDDEYLLNEIKNENPNVTSVKRFMRKQIDSNGQQILIPRQLISVSFLGTTLPSYIYINQVRFEIEPFIYPVIQCLNCLRYGHVLQNCKGKERCKKCGESHVDSNNTTDCQTKCIYCQSYDHSSLSKNCSEYLQQKKIKEAMANHNISFNEAKQLQNNSSYKIATQNRFQVLDNVKEYPPLPRSDQNLISKPRNTTYKISTSQPPRINFEQTKKRKADSITDDSSPSIREPGPKNQSILPNPYRDDFMNYKQKLAEQITVYT